MKLKPILYASAIVGTALVFGGCATYYQVKEPAGGRAYYTTEYEETKAGAVRFKDDKSGGSVTLQNSEIREISKDEYKQGLSTPNASAPTQK